MRLGGEVVLPRAGPDIWPNSHEAALEAVLADCALTLGIDNRLEYLAASDPSFLGRQAIRIKKDVLDSERRGRDSNPRWSKPHTGFRDRPIRPLWHLSD